MSTPPLLGRLPAKGPSSQVAIAGLYAWAVTVAPVGAYHGTSSATKLAAAIAFLSLIAGAAADRWRRGPARAVSLAVFVSASVATWMLAPAALRPVAIDTPQGLAGMLGWGLFALASAGPALGGQREVARVIDDAPLDARRRLSRGDALYLAGGTALALALQCTGWDVADPERALLVRLIAVAAALSIVGASAELALARHAPRAQRSGRARWRGAAPALALLGALALSGLLLGARG